MPLEKSPSAAAFIVVGALIAIIGTVTLILKTPDAKAPEKATGRTTRELALSCTTEMATQFHIHPILKIFQGDKPVILPAYIGIKNGCMRPLHTHDASGKVHVESPEKRDFTLGDFFASWEKPFDRENLKRMTVNGKDSTEYENLVLRDDDEISLYY